MMLETQENQQQDVARNGTQGRASDAGNTEQMQAVAGNGAQRHARPPSNAEQPPDASRFSLSVEEAMALFDAAGVPRARRSIVWYCKNGYLEAILVPIEKGEKYFIDKQSVERRILELKNVSQFRKTTEENLARNSEQSSAQLHATARNAEQATEQLHATVGNATEQPTRHSEAQQDGAEKRAHESAGKFLERVDTAEREKAELKKQNEQLREEKRDLEIANRFKDKYIEQLQRDREQWWQERNALTSRLEERAELIGSLQSQLKQLEAPRRRNRTATHEAEAEPRIIDVTDQETVVSHDEQPSQKAQKRSEPAAAEPEPSQPPQRKGLFRRIFRG